MAGPSQPRKITVVGGSGTVGTPIVASLVASGIHTVSAITRSDSKSDFPSSVKVHRGSYDDESFLADALAGQDILILALSFAAYEASRPLIQAAAKSGVSYIVPCEFGSDATNGPLNEEIQLMNAKKPYRDLIEELRVSSWIGVTNNPWFDFCMRVGYLGVDVKNRKATILDSGRVKANFSTLDRVGQSLAALLSLPEDALAKHKNDWVYFSSFLVSQREILESALKATGTKEEDWEITSGSTLDIRNSAKAEVAKGNHMAGARALFALMFSDGFGGNYSDKVVDYKELGLQPEESLDEELKKLVTELGA
ncbi:hypothetical protein BJ170DRAFT_252980 [Xylariales sp. AK1849]|nr:hypothetical protein BJ170DRAFT_252980 [Xylariales sp. AK1849]